MENNALNAKIEQMEQSELTMDIYRDLAVLYIIKDHLDKQNPVVSELRDVLPEYRKYIDIKRKYQRKELTESAVILAMQNVCTEIKQFVRTLYSSTDMPEEREQIRRIG